MEGVLLRSRARWIAEGEKISKYFCNLEKRNYISKSMKKLIINNEDITDQQQISHSVKEYYEILYKEQPVDKCDLQSIVKNIKILSEDESNTLEGKITFEEATYAIKNMKHNKSPGSDGFTVEFYKVFWKDIGPLIVRSLNEAFERGELSATQKEGVIVCIPKEDKPREYIKNWRPITLLNVSYKIGSACIANRIKTVLSTLIHPDQTGFISGRYMGDNIRQIYDIIHYLDHENLPGLLLCIDFEKAFDSVSWNFMMRVLNLFGFGVNICRWVSTFINDIKSAVVVNGIVSPWFSVKRGCRQGDPISPYLFLLCAEILGSMIRENKIIKGIVINNEEHKISQFADDTQMLTEGDRNSFEQIIFF